MIGGVASMKSSHRPHGKPSKVKVVYFCQVDCCKFKLSNCKPYCVRYRVCPAHLQASSVNLQGAECRFCQQCGKFQPLDEFDGTKRSCRTRLLHHNNSRMQRRREAQTQLSTATSKLLQLQQRRARATHCRSSIEASILAALDDAAEEAAAAGGTAADDADQHNSAAGATSVDDGHSSTTSCEQQQQQQQQDAANSNASREHRPSSAATSSPCAVQQQWYNTAAAGADSGSADTPSSPMCQLQQQLQQQETAWLRKETPAAAAAAAAAAIDSFNCGASTDNVLAAAALGQQVATPVNGPASTSAAAAAGRCNHSTSIIRPSPFVQLQQQQQQQQQQLLLLLAGQAAGAANPTPATLAAAADATLGTEGGASLNPAGSNTSTSAAAAAAAAAIAAGGSGVASGTPTAAAVAAAAGSFGTPTANWDGSICCSGTEGIQVVLSSNMHGHFPPMPMSASVSCFDGTTAATAVTAQHMWAAAPGNTHCTPHAHSTGAMYSATTIGSNRSSPHMANQFSYNSSAAAQDGHAWQQQQQQQQVGGHPSAVAVAGSSCSIACPVPSDSWHSMCEVGQARSGQAVQQQQYNFTEERASSPTTRQYSALYERYKQPHWQYMQTAWGAAAQQFDNNRPTSYQVNSGTLNDTVFDNQLGSFSSRALPGIAAGAFAAADASAAVDATASAGCTAAAAAAAGTVHNGVWPISCASDLAGGALSRPQGSGAMPQQQQQQQGSAAITAAPAARPGPSFQAILQQQQQQLLPRRTSSSCSARTAAAPTADPTAAAVGCFDPYAVGSSTAAAAATATAVPLHAAAAVQSLHLTRHFSLPGHAMQDSVTQQGLYAAARADNGARDGSFAAYNAAGFHDEQCASNLGNLGECFTGSVIRRWVSLPNHYQLEAHAGTGAAAAVADAAHQAHLFLTQPSAVAHSAAAQTRKLQLPHLLPKDVVIPSTVISTPAAAGLQCGGGGTAYQGQPQTVQCRVEQQVGRGTAGCNQACSLGFNPGVTTPPACSPDSLMGPDSCAASAAPVNMPAWQLDDLPPATGSPAAGCAPYMTAAAAVASSYPDCNADVMIHFAAPRVDCAAAAVGLPPQCITASHPPSRPPSCLYLNGDSLGTAAQIDEMLKALGGDEAVAMDLGLLLA